MKRNIIISLAGAALLTLGSVNVATNTATTVNAAVVRVGKYSKLQHNAYIYNSKGKRVGKSVIKRGKRVKILGKKTIKGKHYVRIGKNKYVKSANFSKSSAKENGKLKHNTYVVNSKGKRVSRVALKKGKKVAILGSRTIHGKKYYRIGKDRYVKASNVTKNIPVLTSKDDSANVVENNSANSNSTASANTQNTNSTTNNVTPSVTTPDNNTSSTTTSDNTTQATPSTPVETPSNDKTDGNKAQQPSTDKPSTDKTGDKTNPSKPGKTDNKQNETGKKDDPSTSSVAKLVAAENSTLKKAPVKSSILHAATIYDENGNHVPGMYLEKNAPVTRTGCKLINGQKYYKISVSEDYTNSHVASYNVKYLDFYVNSAVFDPKGKSDAPNHSDKAANQSFSNFMDHMFWVNQLINKKYPDKYGQYDLLFLYLGQFDHFADDAATATSYLYQTKADYEGLEAKANKLTEEILGKPVMEVKIPQEIIDDLQNEGNN